VFYRSPTPAAGAYVNEGDWVDADAVVALVETMKIFNEIKVDVAGRIVRFAAENGQLVHTGDPLVLLEPGERATAEPAQHV
jgi:biotin carboxyl carrier protein